MQTDKLQHTIEMVTHFAYLQPVPDVFTLSPHTVIPWPSQASLIRFLLFFIFFLEFDGMVLGICCGIEFRLVLFKIFKGRV